MRSIFKNLLIITLLSGVGFSWYTVVNDFLRFHRIYGTVFRIENCLVPNPVTTPCFYGAIAFLIGLILLILRKFKYLRYLLIGGTIFAWINFIYEAVKFYTPSNTAKVGCSGIVVTNIFNTPCFYGAFIYLFALIIFFQFDRYLDKELK
jgi:hypothetical protein